MQTIDCIKSRRSVRNYKTDVPSQDSISKIIDTALMTPSGKNGQPWRIKLVYDKQLIDSISALSIYESWMKTAPIFMVIYLDKRTSYNYIKDAQACGAFMQTIMLTAHDIGLGSCWIGEIIARGEDVNALLNINSFDFELMGIITIGYATNSPKEVKRKTIRDILL